MQANNKPTHYLSFYLVVKKLTTLVSTVSFFVTLGFALESFLLVFLRGNAKIVSKALVPLFSPYQNSISVNVRKSAKRGHCTRAEEEWCIMTD